jgi:hypothetical protein
MNETDTPSQSRRQPKRVVLVVSLVLAGALVVSLSACLVGAMFTGPRLDSESRAFADRFIPEVVMTWDTSAFETNMSPELASRLSHSDVVSAFDACRSKLGQFEYCGGSEGESHVEWANGRQTITATYRAKLTYSSGPSAVGITLIKHGDKWQVLGLNVRSVAVLR